VVEVPRPDSSEPLLLVGNPVKLSRVAHGPVTRWPTLGEPTESVLRADLGLGDADLAALRAKGVI
jgi:crotonobetainyl-CoA:carnitine CoA-transferase CaiB-like acyl-CoA transferase